MTDWSTPIKPQKEATMTHPKEQRRQQALVRYLAGDKIEDICREMHCSKSWLYKWKERYQAQDPAWAEGRTTRPKRHPTKVPSILEQTVIHLHRTFVQSGTSGGALAIQQALKQQGIASVPSARTIYRILQRHNKEGG
jgi:transposase-like protein